MQLDIWGQSISTKILKFQSSKALVVNANNYWFFEINGENKLNGQNRSFKHI